MNAKNKIVSAIDLGYGYTKYLQFNSATGEFKPSIFPSIKSLADPKNLGGDFLKERNTVLVVNNGAEYEVGADIGLTTNSYSQSILNPNYIFSDDYSILMKGALKMMNLDFIDILVLGAPVNKIDVARKYLESTWKGMIDLDGVKKIKIGKVIVLPQPLGGFAYYVNQAGNSDFQKQRNLIIDPGYFTFDWLLIDKMKPMKGSGSHESGMSFFIKSIADQIGHSAQNITTLNKIDQYFYNQVPFNFGGKVINLEQYLPRSMSVLENAVQAMMTQITDIYNIDNIILIGGAANTYLPVIKKHIKREILVSKGKSFSNLLGFFSIGQKLANNKC